MHAERAAITTVVPESIATAEILALRESLLRAEVPGRVVAVRVEAGDSVEKGDVLVRLDVVRTESAVAAAGASVAQSKARFEQAQREFARTEVLVKAGGLADQALDDARNELRVTSAVLDASRADARLARRGLTEAVIRAPFSGTIVERHVELGEYLAPGNDLVRIADTSVLKARVLLDPREALGLSVGAKAIVEAFARPGERFAGRVVRVGKVIDPDTRRLPADVELDDTEGRLLPGLVGRFWIATGPPQPWVTLPRRAIFERFGRRHVYVIEDGIARRREVSLGAQRDGRAQIRDGVRAGEWVVTDGMMRVVDGAPIRRVPATHPQSPRPRDDSLSGSSRRADSP
ncbi:MAG: efflux RND transporter periplasmic adaptor subunit [Myxococcota bacterium]